MGRTERTVRKFADSVLLYLVCSLSQLMSIILEVHTCASPRVFLPVRDFRPLISAPTAFILHEILLAKLLVYHSISLSVS